MKRSMKCVWCGYEGPGVVPVHIKSEVLYMCKPCILFWIAMYREGVTFRQEGIILRTEASNEYIIAQLERAFRHMDCRPPICMKKVLRGLMNGREDERIDPQFGPIKIIELTIGDGETVMAKMVRLIHPDDFWLYYVPSEGLFMATLQLLASPLIAKGVIYFCSSCIFFSTTELLPVNETTRSLLTYFKLLSTDRLSLKLIREWKQSIGTEL